MTFSRSSSNSLVEQKRRVSAFDELIKKATNDSPVLVNRNRNYDREQKLMLFVSDKDEITGISIKSTTILREEAHVRYHVNVRNVNKGSEFKVWTVMKRYHEFVDFNDQLRALMSVTNPSSVSQLPSLPPKHNKSWTDHLNEVFIEKRRILLEVYLRRLIRYPQFRRHELTLKFLGVLNEVDLP